MGIASTLLVKPGVSRALESDEFEEVFDDAAIGIELEDVSAANTAWQQCTKHDLIHKSITNRLGQKNHTNTAQTRLQRAPISQVAADVNDDVTIVTMWW